MPIASSILPAAFNHLLAQEVAARNLLKRHAGKVASFKLGATAIELAVAADGLVTKADDHPPAVTISLRAADLPLLIQHPQQMVSYVQIAGDADFANTISQVMQLVMWDVAGDLSKFVGDIAAQRIVDGGVAAMSTVKATQQSVMENIAEYLLEEKPMLVRPSAIGDFTNEVTQLRDDAERLIKRIERIERVA